MPNTLKDILGEDVDLKGAVIKDVQFYHYDEDWFEAEGCGDYQDFQLVIHTSKGVLVIEASQLEGGDIGAKFLKDYKY